MIVTDELQAGFGAGEVEVTNAFGVFAPLVYIAPRVWATCARVAIRRS